jgi:molybdenum cofactor cytidylyltransferase
MSFDGGVLLLAAGMGSRFGSDKRLHELANGDFLALATAKRYASVFDRIVAVLRPGETDIAQVLIDGVREAGKCTLTPVYASDAHLGMGHSLAAGVHAVRGWAYTFVALADMPFVKASTLNALRRAIGEATIVVPTFQGHPGHPVGFTEQYFTELGRLHGDSGARRIVEANRDRVCWIAVDDPGVLHDIDRPKDLQSQEQS